MTSQEHLKEEARLSKILRRRFIEDVNIGEVRIIEKINGVINIKIATLEDFDFGPSV